MKYYEAYDKRYKQVHKKNMMWSSDNNTKIVKDIIDKYNIKLDTKILEIGCGEGRDARFLLNKGYNVLATDVSKQAIEFCKNKDILHKEFYNVLDVLDNNLEDKYSFIYSVACLHMLVLDDDRDKYYNFIYSHLNDNGIALILSMGDGKNVYSSNIENAFNNTSRIHMESGKLVQVATTSCRIIDFDMLFKEIKKNKLNIIEYGTTDSLPDFNKMMYVVIKK